MRPDAHDKPYKGAQSYQLEDSELYFGRDVEADELICQILSARMTVLHAPSGAGKTSLLNARVIPGLEQKGWFAVRILPQDDPTMSLRATTLDWLLPDPDAEAGSVADALAALSQGDSNVPLDTLLEAYDRLDRRDRRRRDLIACVSCRFLRATPVVQTWFSRLLRGTISAEQFSEHLGAIDERMPAFSGKTPVAEIAKSPSAPEFLESYHELLRLLDRPFESLAGFFVNLLHIYGRHRSQFGMVLILDQFEEIFTRFVGRGTVPALPDVKLRERFFAELEDLYTHQSSSIESGSRAPLPIRFVISMRDEYIAQLDSVRQFVPDLAANAYHLSALTRDSAQRAIQEPARIFGYDYEPECYAEIVGQLARDADFVEPAHLQIVCEKLWNVSGKQLAAEGSGGLVSLETFNTLGGVPGMLDSFFDDFLAGLEFTDRLEALEMLAILVTPSGTRNILEEEYLINVPLRNPHRRRELLAQLTNRTIVRAERRLGGKFVEITHEFLIAPIHRATLRELSADPAYALFRSALRSLEHMCDLPLGLPGTRLLRADEYEVLNQRRDQVFWSGWSSEVMLRSAILLGRPAEELKVWLEKAGELGNPPDVGTALDPAAGRRYLTYEELRLVNEQYRERDMSVLQLELVLASQLLHAQWQERDNVIYWTERYVNASRRN
jgi:hypothetical protein